MISAFSMIKEPHLDRSFNDYSDRDNDLSLHGNTLTQTSTPYLDHCMSSSPLHPIRNSMSSPININNNSSSSLIPSPLNRSLLNQIVTLKDRLIEERGKLEAREKDLQIRESKVLNMVHTLTDHYENLRKPKSANGPPTEELAIVSEISNNEETLRREISELKSSLKEKTQENERLTNSFNSVRQANDAFKQEISELQSRNTKLEKDHLLLQGRLLNLQRLKQVDPSLTSKLGAGLGIPSKSLTQIPHTVNTPNTINSANRNLKESAMFPSHSLKNVSSSATCNDCKKLSQTKWQLIQILKTTSTCLNTALYWLTESILSSNSLIASTVSIRKSSNSGLLVKILTKLLGPISEIMTLLSSYSAECELLVVEFIYWSLFHYTQIIGTANIEPAAMTNNDDNNTTSAINSTFKLSATLRRIGEECLHPGQTETSKIINIVKSRNNRKAECASQPAHINSTSNVAELYSNSKNTRVRFLSCLIILLTSTQSDVTAQAYNMLRSDIKDSYSNKLVLAYGVINMLITHLNSPNRSLTSNAIQTILMLVVNQSAEVNEFICSLCTEHFFKTAISLLKDEKLHSNSKEKLAVILQRLSKAPKSLQISDACQFEHCCEETIRRLDPCDSFLQLNLQSVLSNIRLMRMPD